MRHKAKPKINHLLPRVMVCIALLCVGLILSACSTYGLHEHGAFDQEQEQENQPEAEARDLLSKPPVQANPSNDTSVSEEARDTQESEGPETDATQRPPESLDRTVPAEAEAREQVPPENKTSPEEELSSVDDYSLPVDAPEIDPAKGDSDSDRQKQKRESESESSKSNPASSSDSAQESAQETVKKSEKKNTAAQDNAMKESSATSNESLSKTEASDLSEPKIEPSDKANDLESQLDTLESSSVSPQLDEKGLEELAKKADAMKNSPSEPKRKPEEADLHEDGVSQDRAKSDAGLLTQAKDGEHGLLIGGEGGASLQNRDVTVKNAESEGLVIEDASSTGVYGVFNGSVKGDVIGRPSRNIRWNLQRPPSSASENGE